MRRRGWFPLLGAVLVTLGGTWLYAAMEGAVPGQASRASLAVMVMLPLPLLISALWGWSTLAVRPFVPVLGAALGALAVGGWLGSGPAVLQIAASVAAGLVAGLALGSRWRLDAALGLCALALLPAVLYAVAQIPVDQQLQALREQMLTVLESNLPQQADPAQRELALAAERQRLDQMVKVAGQLYPLGIGVGLLGQAGIILLAVRLLVRLGGGIALGWRFGSFSRFRLPFYMVWLLIGGIGLLVSRAPHLGPAGLNLALLVALVMSLQGLAVQIFVVGRLLSPVGRLVFWTMMGIFFGPLVLVSGALLGLADQWLDFRGLDRVQKDRDQGEDQKVV